MDNFGETLELELQGLTDKLEEAFLKQANLCFPNGVKYVDVMGYNFVYEDDNKLTFKILVTIRVDIVTVKNYNLVVNKENLFNVDFLCGVLDTYITFEEEVK